MGYYRVAARPVDKQEKSSEIGVIQYPLKGQSVMVCSSHLSRCVCPCSAPCGQPRCLLVNSRSHNAARIVAFQNAHSQTSPIDEANSPMAIYFQCVCHGTLPSLIFSLGLPHSFASVQHRSIRGVDGAFLEHVKAASDASRALATCEREVVVVRSAALWPRPPPADTL